MRINKCWHYTSTVVGYLGVMQGVFQSESLEGLIKIQIPGFDLLNQNLLAVGLRILHFQEALQSILMGTNCGTTALEVGQGKS